MACRSATRGAFTYNDDDADDDDCDGGAQIRKLLPRIHEIQILSYDVPLCSDAKLRVVREYSCGLCGPRLGTRFSWFPKYARLSHFQIFLYALKHWYFKLHVCTQICMCIICQHYNSRKRESLSQINNDNLTTVITEILLRIDMRIIFLFFNVRNDTRVREIKFREYLLTLTKIHVSPRSK